MVDFSRKGTPTFGEPLTSQSMYMFVLLLLVNTKRKRNKIRGVEP